MPDSTPAAAADKAKRLHGKFTVELGDDHGRRQTLHVFRKRYRGRYSNALLASRRDMITGKRIGMRVLSEGMSQMPDIPGIHIQVDLSKNYAKEYDPLSEMEELHKEADRAFAQATNKTSHKTRAWPEVEYKNLDDHTFKTLVRELCQMVSDNSARVVAGTLPEFEEVREMPGRFINDPSSNSRSKPRYEDEAEEYLEELESEA